MWEQSFEAALWRYTSGKTSWFFVAVPHDLAAHIKSISKGLSPAFGSLSVQAKIGTTRWKTSLFWNGKIQTYVLPVKAEVRRAEKLAIDVTTEVLLVLDV
jgi:hypothetical protein